MFDVKTAPSLKNRPEETMHWFATIGSLTRLGGRITTATTGSAIAGLTLARVGDIVTYRDGSEPFLSTAPALPRSAATCRLLWLEAN